MRIVTDAVVMESGTIAVPSGPGLVATLDESALGRWPADRGAG